MTTISQTPLTQDKNISQIPVDTSESKKVDTSESKNVDTSETKKINTTHSFAEFVLGNNLFLSFGIEVVKSDKKSPFSRLYSLILLLKEELIKIKLHMSDMKYTLSIKMFENSIKGADEMRSLARNALVLDLAGAGMGAIGGAVTAVGTTRAFRQLDSGTIRVDQFNAKSTAANAKGSGVSALGGFPKAFADVKRSDSILVDKETSAENALFASIAEALQDTIATLDAVSRTAKEYLDSINRIRAKAF